MKQLTFGLPRMHKEAGERRDFLPELVATIANPASAVGSTVRSTAAPSNSPTRRPSAASALINRIFSGVVSMSFPVR